MKVNFEEIQRIVEGCYRVANKADLPTTGTPLSCPVRSMVFQKLLNHLVPTYQAAHVEAHNSVQVNTERESWQE